MSQLSARELKDLLSHLDSVNNLIQLSSPHILELQNANDHWRNHLVNYITNNKLHPTEEKYPEQAQMFREIIEKMYQTHLDKNIDYSPYNINATGMIGLVTRLWDKMARIMNLYGFDIATGSYDKERQSKKDESIEDNLRDLSIYGIIAQIFRAGKWGK